MIDDFDGMAATVRFDDGAVEIEYAMSNYQPDLTKFIDSQNGADMVAGLPDDTVAAFGMSLEEGWAGAMLDYVKRNLPDESATIDEQLAQFESETGLAFPEDVETLLGEGVTVSLGSGLDPDAVANGGPGEVPVGIRIDGDADEIQAVLDKIAAQAGPELAELMQVTEGDGYAVLALQEGYRGELEAGGSLGDSAAYSEVVESDEAQSLLFVNFNADDDWLVRLTGDSPEVSKNLEPLSAFGSQRLGRRRRGPRTPEGHHRLTGPRPAPLRGRGSRPASAADGGGHRSGDRHQVRRRELEVEAAPSTRDQDRVVLERRGVEHRAVPSLLPDRRDAAGDVAGGALGGRDLRHHRLAAAEGARQRLEVELSRDRDDPDDERAVQGRQQRLEDPGGVDVERLGRLEPVPFVTGVGRPPQGPIGQPASRARRRGPRRRCPRPTARPWPAYPRRRAPSSPSAGPAGQLGDQAVRATWVAGNDGMTLIARSSSVSIRVTSVSRSVASCASSSDCRSAMGSGARADSVHAR